jgi:eukaryotic-like serine/threonine-protein kinase
VALQPGQMLSHYRLAQKIGEGGMGEVWRATDTTLDRSVAIKILPDTLSQDGQLLARFEREAKLLASLNHPNIAVIHGLHHSGTTHFLAMELVAGEDLAHRIRRGALPVEEVTRLARQVAEAVEAAHEQGVIHRDLKPANIMVSNDAAVKVLDFGLAKSLESHGGSAGAPSMSPTLTGAATRAGLILGTAAYMSPEQARGRAVDRRTDIWAFGCVLYEMLAGRPVFPEETISDTLAAVLKTDPDWSALPSGTPDALRRLAQRCLIKDPRQRLRDIGEARVLLEELERNTGEATVAPAASSPSPSTIRRLRPATAFPWVVAILGVAVAAGLAGWSLKPAPAGLPLRKFRLPNDSESHAGSGPQRVLLGIQTVSPDGKRVAYAAEGGIWIRDLSRLDPRLLASASEAAGIFWSPDSAWVGYFSERKLWKVPAAGGTPITVCPLEVPADESEGGAWLEDGRIVFAIGSGGLFEVPASGGDPSTLLPVGPDESDFHDAAPLPGGKGVLFAVHRKKGRDTVAIYAAGKRKDVLRAEGQVLDDPTFSPSGHILYSQRPRNRGIWALPFSLAKLEATGKPFLVASDAMSPSVSRDGTLVYWDGVENRISQLAWIDRTGREIGTVGHPQQMDPFPRLSPDSRRIAVSIVEGASSDIWIVDAVRGTQTRLTFDPTPELIPAWSPSGDRLIFTRGAAPSEFKLIDQVVDGTEAGEVLGSGAGASFAPDGKSIAFMSYDEKTWLDISVMPLSGERKPTPFLRLNGMEVAPQISPDGSLIAYQSDESGHDEIYLKKFPGGEGKWQVSVDGGDWPRWNGRGDRLYYVGRDNLMEVTVSTHPGVTLGTPVRLFTREPAQLYVPFGWPEGFDVTPDGQRFLLMKKVPQQSASGIAIVQNWYAEFLKKE